MSIKERCLLAVCVVLGVVIFFVMGGALAVFALKQGTAPVNGFMLFAAVAVVLLLKK